MHTSRRAVNCTFLRHRRLRAAFAELQTSGRRSVEAVGVDRRRPAKSSGSTWREIRWHRAPRRRQEGVVMAEKFDAIVIGAGQAGPSLAVRLAGSGMRVAVVERHRFGGTCVNTGCIPTKTLVASARAAWVARRGADYGVEIAGEVRVDMKKVKA